VANNRLFLAYRPTGQAILLAKRMAFGWCLAYPETVAEDLGMFFSALGFPEGASQDDFCLCMESAENQPNCLDNPKDWQYNFDADGKVSIRFGDHVLRGTREDI